MSPSAYLGVIARSTIARLWWLAIAPAALIAYGAAADRRWIVVGLMLIFIVYPLSMSLTILRYATLPKLALRASATMADIEGDIITLYKRGDDSNPPSAIDKTTVTAATVSKGIIYLLTGPKAEDIILIPATAITADELKTLMRLTAPSDTYDFSN